MSLPALEAIVARTGDAGPSERPVRELRNPKAIAEFRRHNGLPLTADWMRNAGANGASR